jgi:hypothetical protein
MRDACSINEMHSDSPQSGTMLVLALMSAFCRVRDLAAFCELRTIRSAPDAPRQLTQSCQCGTNESRAPWNKTFPQQVFSLATRSRFGSMRERKHEPELHSVQKHEVASATPDRNSNGKIFALAAAALGMAASLSAGTAHAQKYPCCVSREGYLYCFYKTQEQCQWTSGIGGCAVNPRLLFPNKPGDSNQDLLSHMKIDESPNCKERL